MNKFVEKYNKARDEFNIEERVYKGRYMVRNAITDENARLNELEKYKSEYFTAANKFGEVISFVIEEIKRCGYLIRIGYKGYKNKEMTLEMIRVGSIDCDNSTFTVDESVKAVINDKGLIKYERNENYLWNVCYALDSGFDVCDKKTFDKWIKNIKKEFNKNIGRK